MYLSLFQTEQTDLSNSVISLTCWIRMTGRFAVVALCQIKKRETKSQTRVHGQCCNCGNKSSVGHARLFGHSPHITQQI